jgi:hypothetical protein
VFFLSGLQGVDVWDDGYHLVQQQQVIRWGECPEPMAYLSYLLGGAWLALWNSMVWYRFGGAVIYATCSLICFFILDGCFPHRRAQVFWSVLAFSLLIHSRIDNSAIHYGSVPALLSLLFLYCLHRVNRDVLPALTRKWLFAMGFLGPLMVLAKFPHLTVLLFPFLLIAYYSLVEKAKLLPAASRAFFPVGSGVVLGVMFSAGILFIFGHAEDYYQGITGMLGSARGDQGSYTYQGLVLIYLKRVSQQILILCTLLPVYAVFWKGLRKPRAKPLSIVLSVCATYAVFLFTSRAKDPFRTSAGTHFLAFLVVFTTITGCFLLLSPRFRRELPEKNLLVFSLFMSAVNLLGTDTGIYKSAYMLWFTGPFILVALLRAWTHRFPSYAPPFWLALIIPLLFIGFFQEYTNAVRTKIDRFQMTTAFTRIPFMKGIYEDSDKVMEMQAVTDTIERYARKGDLLQLEGEPIYYAFSSAQPFVSSPLILNMPAARVRGALYAARRRHGRLPTLVVTGSPPELSPTRRAFRDYFSDNGYVKAEEINGREFWILR